MSKTNNSDENFLKQKLNYFYFINTDDIIQNINYKIDILKDPSTTNKFLTIFSEIVDATKPYVQFILSNNRLEHCSIFGEEPCIPEIETYFLASGISLFHHCILCGATDKMYASLPILSDSVTPTTSSRKKHYTFTDSTKYIRFSASTEPAIKQGFKYSCYNHTAYIPYASDSKEHNRFGKICNTLKMNPQNYRSQVLNALNKVASIYDTVSPSIENSKHSKISVTKKQYYFEKHQSASALFLATEPLVRTFDNSLLKYRANKPSATDNMISNYLKLYEKTYKQKYHFNIDNLFFYSVLEKTYGFSFYGYLLRETNQLSLKENAIKTTFLLGNNFDKIINDYAAKTTIEFNDAIFLKYALIALRHSEHLASTFPREKNRPLFYDNETTPSIETWSANAQIRLSSFYKMLTHVVIPLIEDLWFVITKDKNLKFKISLSKYEAFINKNYHVITSDYTQLPNLLTPLHTSIDYTEFYTLLKKHTEEFYSPAASENHPLSCSPLSLEEKQYFCKLINTHCQVKKHDYFIYKHPDILNLLLDNSISDEQHNIFQIQHVKNLFSLASKQ